MCSILCVPLDTQFGMHGMFFLMVPIFLKHRGLYSLMVEGYFTHVGSLGLIPSDGGNLLILSSVIRQDRRLNGYISRIFLPHCTQWASKRSLMLIKCGCRWMCLKADCHHQHLYFRLILVSHEKVPPPYI